MSYLIIIALVIVLYARQWGYRLLIDDPVPRDGYLYEGPKTVEKEFYEQTRSKMATVTNVSVFLANCLFINLLWGFNAALLFAVFPLNVFSATWNTGNYYASTVLLVLASEYFLRFSEIFTSGVAMVFFGAALNSTVNALSYVFIAPFSGKYGFLMVMPFLFFIFGKRFKIGIKQRKERALTMNNTDSKFAWKNLVHTPLILAYYCYLTITVNKMGFFHDFNKGLKHKSKDFLIMSILVCIVWAGLTFAISPKMMWWWFASLIIFTHIQGHLGQYVTERYLALSNVAFCVMLGMVLTPYPILIAIIATTYFWKSWNYIPAYRHNLDLFSHSICNFPMAGENYVNLSSYHLERENYQAAIQPLIMAERLAQGHKQGLYVNLAVCCIKTRLWNQALHYTKMALFDAPKDQMPILKKQQLELEDKIHKLNRIGKQVMEVW